MIKFKEQLNEIQLRLELDRHAFEQINKEARDNTIELIGRYVYVMTKKGDKVTTTDLCYLLSISENTVREKVNLMTSVYGVIEKRESKQDKRTIYLYPTKKLERTLEVHTTRMLKTIFEVAPIYKRFVGKEANQFMTKTGTSRHPGFHKTPGENPSYHRKIYNHLVRAITYNIKKTPKVPSTTEGNKYG